MRIVGGRNRGRRIAAPPGRDVRPTADRLRESLFNILVHGAYSAGGGSPLIGATVLDAFAGAGAMGLEALSRGAARAVFMETAGAARDAIGRNVAACHEEPNCEILNADATRPPRATLPCAIAFLDPPYGKGLAEAALSALAGAGWLAENAICAVELAAKEPFARPDGFATLDERRYGAARVIMLRYRAAGTIDG